MRRLWQILAQNNNNNVAYIAMRTFKKGYHLQRIENNLRIKHFAKIVGHYNNDDNNTQS